MKREILFKKMQRYRASAQFMRTRRTHKIFCDTYAKGTHPHPWRECATDPADQQCLLLDTL